MLVALWLIGGLVFLTLGSEGLVRGSVNLANRMGLSPLLIGLTLVGFGTSTPELMASLQAAHLGSPGIAVGNVVGSNIFNILGILGLVALISVVHVNPKTWQRDGTIMVATTVLCMGLMAYFAELTRPVGLVFVAGLVGFLYFVYTQEKGHPVDLDELEASKKLPVWAAVGLVVAGLAGLMLGAKLLVEGAITLARMWGMSETVIGLTIVAAGTSLPELATSINAAIRKQADIAVGNVIGSNIFNILGILGITAIVAPIPVPEQIIRFDMWVMLAAAVALLVYARNNKFELGRTEGLLFCGAFGLYTLALL